MLQRLSTTPTTDLVDPWKAVTAPLTLPMAQRQASTNRTGPHIRTFIGLRAAYWSMRGIVRCPTYGERQTLEKVEQHGRLEGMGAGAGAKGRSGHELAKAIVSDPRDFGRLCDSPRSIRLVGSHWVRCSATGEPAQNACRQ